MSLTAEDKHQFLELLTQLTDPVNEVLQIAGDINSKQKNGEFDSTKGVSFLDVKNQLMLSYLINMTHLMHEKLCGHSIQDSPDINRLVEIRTVLEKMRPIDQKLKYQIDKLIRTAKMGIAVDNDPLRLKPNPDNLIGNEDEEDKSDAGSDRETSQTKKVYKPARLAPVYYDGEESAKQKKERQMEMVKKRLANSAVIKDLQREYVDGPEEIRETPDFNRLREDRLSKERKEYEEKYFIRMSVSKQEKTAARKLRTMSGLESITNFGELNFLTGRGRKDNAGSSKKRKHEGPRKHKGGSSKGGSSKAKRRKFRK